MPLHVGFDASELYMGTTGVYTYTSQLLQHLARLPDAPAITLVDGLRQSSLQELQAAHKGALPTVRFARPRAPLLHLVDGPWRKDYRTRRLAWKIDERVLIPFWSWSDNAPWLMRWRMPHDVAASIDIYHWSDNVFLRVPDAVHVATVHDATVLLPDQWHLAEHVEQHSRQMRRLARYATRLIAVSEHTKRDVVRLLGVAPERIDVIPEAAGPEFRPPADPAAPRDTLARYGLAPEGYVFYVGTIEPRKNVVRLAEAFRAATARDPALAGTKLVLAGSKGWLAEPIYQGLDAVGLGDRLVLPGRVPQGDLPALLAGAGAVAYVSLYEGFGLPPLEALACGAAVVASNTTAIPEVVGDAGLLVDPLDVGAIAGALERVLTDGALRAELRARGLRRSGEFSWGQTAELTLQTYRHALADMRAGPKDGRSPRTWSVR